MFVVFYMYISTKAVLETLIGRICVNITPDEPINKYMYTRFPNTVLSVIPTTENPMTSVNLLHTQVKMPQSMEEPPSSLRTIRFTNLGDLIRAIDAAPGDALRVTSMFDPAYYYVISCLSF